MKDKLTAFHLEVEKGINGPVRLNLLTLTNDSQMGLLGGFRVSNDSTQRLFCMSLGR